VVQAGFGILDTWVANHWRRPSSASWHRAAPKEHPSIGLLCEADLTKPDIIETAAGDPKPTLNGNTRPEALVEIEADIVGWIARSLRLGVLADFPSSAA
jgi:hypothetical protein